MAEEQIGYRIDVNGVWTGASFELDPAQGYHGRAVFTPPPTLAPGEVAVWDGAWTVDADGAYQVEPRRTELYARVTADTERRLASGAPFEIEGRTLHVALDDGSRADMTAMGTTAIGALAETVPWPESYQQGWITIENVRIPLPTPAYGLPFAAEVGDHYARIRQNSRTLKDAIMAAVDLADLDAIDIENGWPS